MRRFNYACLIVILLILAAMPATAQSIFVSGDEWFTDATKLYDDTQLTKSVAGWLTAGAPGKNILILSSNHGLNNTSLVTLLTGAGYKVTLQQVVPASFLNGSAPKWDAVFVSGDCVGYPLTFSSAVCGVGFANLNTALIKYVNAGGNVLLEVGIDCSTGDTTWNTFLNTFGLSIIHGCNILNGKVNVSPFQTQVLYGPELFTNVNAVYIGIPENVKDLQTNPGVQIFSDSNGDGLYGAWRPGTCSAPYGGLYSDGAVNATIDAYTINNGFVVSDSFGLPSGDHSMQGFCFYAWVLPGDFLESVEASVTSQPAGGTLYFDKTVNLDCSRYCAAGQPINGGTCGTGITDVYRCTAEIDPIELEGGTYWLNLQNAASQLDGFVFWDQNNGRLCSGFKCPSLAFQDFSDTIPAETFDIFGISAK